MNIVSLDKELVDALRRDPTTAKLDAQDRALVDYCVRMTKYSASMIEADVQNLRMVGFNDQAILQITMICGWFNYVNRVADALGLGKQGIIDGLPTTNDQEGA